MPEDRQAAAARAFWSGTITFGLVSIPVDLFAGVRGRHTSMRMVDAKGRPLGREYYSGKHESGLTKDDLVRAYETEEGEMIVLTDEELESVAPEMSRDIELRRFVPKQQIPPPYWQRPYFLAPSGRSQKAYQLLAQTMERTGRIGIGTFVMRGHQYLVAIISDGKLLRAETLRFAAEVRSPEDVGLPKTKQPPARETKRFSKAVASLRRDEVDMDELSDRYAEAIESLVNDKAREEKHVLDLSTAEQEEDEEQAGGEVVDLMKLLKTRLGASGKRGAARSPTPAAKDSGGLEKLSKEELYERAQALHITGRSKMAKKELIDAIQGASAAA